MKKTIYTFIVTSFLTLAAILIAQAQDGSLDLSFSSDGKVVTDIGGFCDQIYSVAIQSDGKIVVAGFSFTGSNEDFAVVRYNSNGTLDNTFSSDGKVTTAIGSSDDDGYSVAIQDNGKIVVAGHIWNGSNSEIAVVRYNSNGTLDNTFSSDGKVTTVIGSSSVGRSVNIQSDGKILVGGTSVNESNSDFAVVRYDNDGTLDTTFSSDGIVSTPIGSADDYGQSVAIQSDSKIVVAGQAMGGFALVRYTGNGTLDSTFSSDGKVVTNVGNYTNILHAVAIQGDGKIVVTGYADNGSDDDFVVIRYNSDGNLDNTFDTDGTVTTDFGNSDDSSNSLAIQSDGKIVATGYSDYNSGGYDFALTRYNNDGSLDLTFDTDGKVTTAIGCCDDAGRSVAIQGDGKIVVVGENCDIEVVRYNARTVGIVENNDEGNTLAISPNPFNNELVIKGAKENAEILIYDVMGNEMLKQKTFYKETKINTERLLPGCYFLFCKDGYKMDSAKLVKL